MKHPHESKVRARGEVARAASVRVAGATLALATFVSSPTSRAEVTANGPDSFTVKHEVTVPLPPRAAYQRLLLIREWWDPAHTYSGSASHLTLDTNAGGCWCEQLADGGFVEHMHVMIAWPGKMLRMSGGLGPLQEIGASGVLTYSLKAEREGTKVTLTYVVRGASGSLEKLAGPVDMVLGQALKRYAEPAPKP
jgi:hypothetical protein